jgi:hypothetical protein
MLASLIFSLSLVILCNSECPSGLDLNLDKPQEFIRSIVALDYQHLLHPSSRADKSKSSTAVLEAAIDKTLVRRFLFQ